MPPLNLLIKPASGSCNLKCRYCFYADEMSNREKPIYGRMTDETLEIIVKKGFDFADRSITFAFQGGEPTLMGLDFFRNFCRLKVKYNTKKLRVHCAIQTNGTLLDKAWAEFFAKEKFLVGVSLDGMRSIHDQNRVSAGGEGSFKNVIHSARLLSEAGADFNILTVLTENSARNIERIYKFFVSQNFLYQQYIPCLEPLLGDVPGQECLLSAEIYGNALKVLFDIWFNDIIKGIQVYNRYFENLVGIVAGYEPESCDMIGHCSLQYVFESDGSVYPCDFYALDEYKLGNITEDSFDAINLKRTELQFIERSMQTNDNCLACQWKNLCRGGCRRNRENVDEGRLGGNRFCSAYQDFFTYASERLRYLGESVKRK